MKRADFTFDLITGNSSRQWIEIILHIMLKFRVVVDCFQKGQRSKNSAGKWYLKIEKKEYSIHSNSRVCASPTQTR